MACRCGHIDRPEAVYCSRCGAKLDPPIARLVHTKVVIPCVAVGCPRCGSQKIKQYRCVTGFGWFCFFGGLLFALCTFGTTLLFCLLAVFLTEKRGYCKTCGWTWRT